MARRVADRLSRLSPALVLSGALAAFWGLSLLELAGESFTVDELVHLPAGYSYLTRQDYRLNPEHPPLPKIWAALPLLFQDVREPDESGWARGDQEDFGYRFLHQSGNRPETLLRSARIMVLFWGSLTLCTVYGLARELYGPLGALIALTVATFCPPLLAHGHLVTMDAPLAALFLLSIVAFREVLLRPGPRSSSFLGFMLGALVCTKFVAVILLPALGWVTLLVWKSKGRLSPDSPPPSCSRREAIACGAVALSVAYLVIWAVYGFRFEASAGVLPASGGDRPAAASAAEAVVLWARDVRVLPEAFLNGFLYQLRHNTDGHTSYAFGQHGGHGWWWFFPAVVLVKTPVPSLLLMGWGLIRSGRRYLAGDHRESLLLVPLGCYVALALAGSINLGVRLVLPIFPMLAVLSGSVVAPAADSAPRAGSLAISGVLAGMSALGTLVAAPYFLAYFNAPSLLCRDRYEMLVDSDLDWGQDLRRLAEFVDARKIEGLKLAYFGSGSPRSLGLRHERLSSDNVYWRYEPEWREAGPLRPGDWIAVSATIRAGFFPGPDRERWRELLRDWTPAAVLGHSIFVYRVPEAMETSGSSVRSSPLR